ncbi:hypothetical protein CC1G_02141 [Coprinopsis cinerea okayama7|uniref:Alpha/beta hydrolase fold-3 domain-containing protein n=1 Tax=Coprinopsis cinerea (strain Okayama-7 / 130 / ATCC MYA-4618 / FGSC 9003) TaxID=240176 RepID=A8NKC0_COPC7|nr:hypothetical protein CC1G_02141 [Coprinopsis cinerea okayama7\|eukprot:XP_001834405.1 hypothetical protein CC1G_02141 [Coprinopsis cinerea okayama7\
MSYASRHYYDEAWSDNHELPNLPGPSSCIYSSWTRRHQLPGTVEEFVDDSGLFWIGPKRKDRVILVVHGGGFCAPLAECSMSFWNYVRRQLNSRSHIEVGVAFLDYTPIQDAPFPTQLRQLAVAVDHLLATGTHPKDLHIVGDGMGGNIVMQFLSQLLHPIKSIGPITKLSSPIRGVYLMSPLVTAESRSESSKRTDFQGLVDVSHSLRRMGAYVNAIPTSRQQYAEPFDARDVWWDRLPQFADRFLVSVGEEVLGEETRRFTNAVLTREGTEVQFEFQEGGLHCNPYYDFFVSDNPSLVASLTNTTIEWLERGFLDAPV